MPFNCIFADGSIETISDDQYRAAGCPPYSRSGAALIEIDDLSQVATGDVPAISVNVSGDAVPQIPLQPVGLPPQFPPVPAPEPPASGISPLWIVGVLIVSLLWLPPTKKRGAR